MSMRKVRYYWLHTIIDFLLCSHVEKRVKFLIACCTIQHKLLRKNTENLIHVFAYKCYYYLLIYIRMCLVMKRSFIEEPQCWVYSSRVEKYIKHCVEKRKYDGITLFFLLTNTSTERILNKIWDQARKTLLPIFDLREEWSLIILKFNNDISILSYQEDSAR